MIRLTAIVLALIGALLLLMIGIYLGGHPSDLPKAVQNAAGIESDDAVVDEGLSQIKSSFYRPVNQDKLANDSLKGAVAGLRDRFSTYFTPQQYKRFQEVTGGSYAGVGMDVTASKRGLLVQNVYPGTPAKKAGIKPGDQITEINGKSIAGKNLNAATALIRGKPGTQVKLTVLSDGKSREVEVSRAKVEVPVVDSKIQTVALPSGKNVKVAEIALRTFTSGASKQLSAAVASAQRSGAQAMVLDLRNNGGGLLNEAVLVSSIFVEDGTIVTTKSRSQGTKVYPATGKAIAPNLPIAVLVNGGTASAAEIVTAALHDLRKAPVVGGSTFGKGVFQEISRLSNGGALDLTVGEYFTPNGANLGGGGSKQGKGIKPDVAAKDSPKTRLDEALQRARERAAQATG